MSDSERALIKGSTVRDSRKWIRDTFGEQFYREALATLSRDDHLPFAEDVILASSWYPLTTWNVVLASCRKLAKERRGIGEEEFDMRNVGEAGSTTLKTLYKFVLGLASPESVLERVPRLFMGLFQGRGRFHAKVSPGHALLGVYDAHPDIAESCRHHYLTGCRQILTMNGVRDARYDVTRDERTGANCCFEFEVTYSR